MTSASRSSWPSSCHQHTWQSSWASGTESVRYPQHKHRAATIRRMASLCSGWLENRSPEEGAGLTAVTLVKNFGDRAWVSSCYVPARTPHLRLKQFQPNLPCNGLARTQVHHPGVHPPPLLSKRIHIVELRFDGHKRHVFRRIHLYRLDLRRKRRHRQAIIRVRIDQLHVGRSAGSLQM